MSALVIQVLLVMSYFNQPYNSYRKKIYFGWFLCLYSLFWRKVCVSRFCFDCILIISQELVLVSEKLAKEATKALSTSLVPGPHRLVSLCMFLITFSFLYNKLGPIPWAPRHWQRFQAFLRELWRTPGAGEHSSSSPSLPPSLPDLHVSLAEGSRVFFMPPPLLIHLF